MELVRDCKVKRKIKNKDHEPVGMIIGKKWGDCVFGCLERRKMTMKDHCVDEMRHQCDNGRKKKIKKKDEKGWMERKKNVREKEKKSSQVKRCEI